jgi:ribosomal subunit interface protein
MHKMQVPLQISYHHIDPSPAIEARIRKEVDKLERFHHRITGCKVTVKAPHKRHQQGDLYEVRVDVTVPSGEIIASRNHHDNHAHEDAYVAIRDAFRAARRQLEDVTNLQRGKVKLHEAPPEGRIMALFPEMNYGLIKTLDGREIYFHRNSVVDAEFDRLCEGDEVRFAEEEGENGPQASTVHLSGKQRPVS